MSEAQFDAVYRSSNAVHLRIPSEITGASIQRLLAAPLKEILKMFAGLPV
jgi:hypothetical protein